MSTIFQYIAFSKPFNVLSQFTSEGGKRSLAEFGLPKGVYPVGRLDYDSEGLLLLTDDPRLNLVLLSPKNKHLRTYWLEVESFPDEVKLARLREGVEININGKPHLTLPAEAKLISAPVLPPRNPPIRLRANIPTYWIELRLSEGKNRQARRMTAKINCPTLRLVRVAIENLEIGTLAPGQWINLTQIEIYRKLNLKL